MFIKHVQKLLTPIFFRNCLFGAIKITNTTNSDTDKWQYSSYGVGFDSTGSFTHPDDGKNAKNVVVFGADMTNSKHATNQAQSVLVFGHGLIQKINDTTIYAEKLYSRNFTVDNQIFCLSLHYNGDNSYLFVNSRKVTKFKTNNFELINYRMCLGGLSKDYKLDKKSVLGNDVYYIGYITKKPQWNVNIVNHLCI